MKESLKNFNQFISKYEKYFFSLIVFVHILPFLFFNGFPTVDGPAHLYNSSVLNEMMLNDNSSYFDYYSFNNLTNPNVSGHFILIILLQFLPALLAEKFLLIATIVLIPVSFRYLFNQLELKETYLLYFIFPFTYSFMFYYGFYNYHIGLIFFLFAVGYWVKSFDDGFTIKRALIMLVLSLGTFFSHLFVFAFLLGVIGFINLFNISLGRAKLNKELLTKIGVQLLIFLPGIILSIFYFQSNPLSEGEPVYKSTGQLLDYIQGAQPAKGVSYGREAIFTKWIPILLGIHLLVMIVQRFIKLKKSISNNSIIWGALSVLMLIFLFIAPDSTAGSVGFVSARILLFFFLFFILFLGANQISIWVKIPIFILITYVNIALVNVYFDETKKHAQTALNISRAGTYVNEYKVVYPINDSKNWLYSHASNYLAANKPMIILENYEAAMNHFPLRWNTKSLSKYHLGDSNILPSSPETHSQKEEQVDYVFILRNVDNNTIGSQEKSISSLLKNNYTLTFQSDDEQVFLYKKKN